MKVIHRESDSGSNLLVGVALGAALMYFADPQSGRRRRKLAVDQYRRTTRQIAHGAEITWRDLSQRATGVAACTRQLFKAESADDVVLVERVRSALGRCSSHPGAIAVEADNGRVTLRGDALASEGEAIAARLRKVPGVRQVVSELDLHESPQDVPLLQGRGNGGYPRSGFTNENWSPAWRVMAGALGAGLLTQASRRGGLASALVGLFGTALLVRGATNRTVASAVGLAEPIRGVAVRKSIHIDAPPEVAYRHWNVELFPEWMSHVREVRPLGENRFRWVVDGPARVPIEWDAEVTGAVTDVYLSWRSVPGSVIDNAGSVRFVPEGEGTRVEVTFCYMPPGGLLGHAIARVLGADPQSRMDDDLMRLKSRIETGRAPHDAARRVTNGASPPNELRH